MGGIGRKFLEIRIRDERAEELRLRQASEHEAADRCAYVIDRLLDRYLRTQFGEQRGNTPSHV
jgi:hypothetical protein